MPVRAGTAPAPGESGGVSQTPYVVFDVMVFLSINCTRDRRPTKSAPRRNIGGSGGGFSGRSRPGGSVRTYKRSLLLQRLLLHKVRFERNVLGTLLPAIAGAVNASGF